MRERQYFVYILASRFKTLYVGVTNDLERRIVDAKGDEIGWRNTDHLEADARKQVAGDVGFEVAWEDCRPGDIIVAGKGKDIGHCGVAGKCGPNGPETVVHCNARGGAPFDETDLRTAGFTRENAVILRVR
jgi:hypothetical protein